jgi:hypothetical protein
MTMKKLLLAILLPSQAIAATIAPTPVTVQDASGNVIDSSLGGLKIYCVGGCGGGSGGSGFSLLDKDVFTYGTTGFVPIGGAYQDGSPSLAAGHSGVARLTANRGLHVNLRDASGNEIDFGTLATASAQATANSSLSTIATNTGNGATSANQTLELTKLDALHTDNSAATATMSQVTVTTGNTSLLASNSSRKKCILFNDGTGVADVALGATATTSAYSFQLKPLAYFECSRPIYTGAISAITASGTTTVKVTEVQ